MTLLENNGLINKLLGFLGLGPFEMINTQGAVVLGMVYNYLPFMILPLYSVMVKIENSLVEAASDLRCSASDTMKHVLLPLSMPGVTTGIIMVFVPSVSTFVISRMLGGGSFMLIGDLIEMQFLGNAYNPNLGAAISMVLMFIILICMALTNLFKDPEEKEGLAAMKNKKTGAGWLSNSYIALIMIFLYAPILVLMIYSFNESKSRSGWAGFSLHWYRELFKNDAIISALLVTLFVAFVSAILATVIGTLAAIGIQSMKSSSKTAIMNFTYVPVVSPEIVMGVSLMLLFVLLRMESGLITLVLAHVTFNLPYVILSVMPKLRQMDKHLFDAAMDLGCTPGMAFRKVMLPEIMPGIITGFLMALTFSLDDFNVQLFCKR